MSTGSLLRLMASSHRMSLWVLLILGGLLSGSCSAGPPCPPPCSCPPATLTCRGCPNDYLALSNDTQVLSVTGCRDIQYFLRLHRPHTEGKLTNQFVLHKLEITDSLMDKIPESYVNNDYPIQSLNLSNNSIESIDPGLEADNLTHLDLSRNRLRFIGNRTFEHMNNMLYLDISANSITNMSVECFVGLEKLAHLDISQNNLTYLKDAMFYPLTSLQQLNMSYNMLESLSEKCFRSLLLLQQLDISYNRLTSVAPGTLQFLPNLAKLLLADNPQLEPDAQIFVGTGRRLQQVDASRTGLRRVPEALTHSVRYLSLAGNRISTLRCGDLDGYPLLHMLDFDDNIIEYVEDDALGRLEMISRLLLNKNKLQTVPKMLPDKLLYLSLDHNLIQNLTINDFGTLSNLKCLVLSNNLISYIQENAFTQLISLEELDVSNNPLQVLTPNTFAGPVSLKTLHMININISPPAKDISFPVPSPEGIENLYLERSPGITRELLADTAALAAMTRLQFLDVSYANITYIRSDLLHFLPQLKVLRLLGNTLNCSDLNWLADWMRENANERSKEVLCTSPPKLKGKYIIDLPSVSQHVAELKINYIELMHPTSNKTKSDTLKTLDETRPIVTHTRDIQSNLREFFKSQKLNTPNTTENKMNGNYLAKSLLDIPADDQHRMNFKLPTNINLSEKRKDIKNEKQRFTTAMPQLSASVKKQSLLLNTDFTKDKIVTVNLGNEPKQIHNLISIRNDSIDVKIKSKLTKIFSELSRTQNNSSNLTNLSQKINPTTQESVSLCIANGNLNGTENKTKCSQHPEIAPKHSENHENKNIKPGRFIYRKNGNAKSSNNKLKKSKYVSRPNLNMNETKVLMNNRVEINKTSNATHLVTNLTIANESSETEFTKLKKHESMNQTTQTKLNVEIIGNATTILKNKEDLKFSKTPIKEELGVGMKLIEKQGTAKHDETSRDVLSRDETVTELSDQRGENVSEHQTSRFRADESGGTSLGFGALVGLIGALCAALVGAILARRRPLARRARAPEMMEVQTISAVGELW